MHKKRYGGVFVKQKVSSTIKITGLVMVVILIPLNDFFEHFLRKFENEWIISKQADLVKNNFIEKDPYTFMLYYLIKLVDQNCVLKALLILFYSFDNILAFKGAICYCFGNFFMIIFSIYYTSDRPFWVDGNIRTYEGYC